jgi:oligopeptide transport system substrate-binding protein
VVQETDENGNVRYVTAHDFVYGWTRTLDPATASDYAYVLAIAVAGGAEYNAGDMTVELGVKALDDWTLQVTSPIKAAFVPLIHGMWMARPQPQWAIEEYGDGWTLAGNFPTYGSYTLKEWEPNVRVVIVKNPFWPGTEGFPPAQIDEVVFIMLEESALLAAYEAGELDYTNTFPFPDLARMKAERPDELYTGPQDCTYYYGYNVLKAPFDNVHMRRAFSMAVDRQAVVNLLGAGQQPAGFFSRPNFAASPKQEDYPGFGITSDPAGAQVELQAYFDETGTTLADVPPITLMHNTSEGHARIAQAIQQMWRETLGIEVQITNQEFQVYLETLDEDAPQVWRLGWCKDYPDPDNFLATVFYSTSGNNDTNWANPQFDALVDEARTEEDLQKRKDLYAQAEDILTREDAAMIPIYFYTHSDLTQGYVERTYSQTGNERFDKWDIAQ